MPDSTLYLLSMGVVFAAPALAFCATALLMLTGTAEEHRVTGVSAPALTASFVASMVAVVTAWTRPVPDMLRLGSWFEVGEYSFGLGILSDDLSCVMVLVTTGIAGLIGRFSVKYLHHDPGFARFFLLLNLFSIGMLVLVTGPTLDQLFVGWELVGITSALLVGYFHLRRTPVDAGLRVFTTYRFCDIGLLLGAVLLHHYAGAAYRFDPGGELGAQAMGTAPATIVSLCLLFGAIGKSAQLPVGGWLPRAMEGPTPSSALFYGALSVHAGVYLMLRASPMLAVAPAARIATIATGGLTALYASAAIRMQTDAKNTLAYATMGQVGLMFVEIGLGFERLAVWHLVAHLMLRCFQFLRTPSALRDAHLRHSSLGHASTAHAPEAAETSSMGMRLYRLGLERFHLETLQERWVTAPLFAVGTLIDRIEHGCINLVGGPEREPHGPERQIDAAGAPVSSVTERRG
jgi:NADH-quinone oxidoreductase subunit L